MGTRWLLLTLGIHATQVPLFIHTASLV